MQAILNKINYTIPPKLTIFYILLVSICLDIAYGALVYFGGPSLPISLMFRATIICAFIICLLRQNTFEANYIKVILGIWALCFCYWLVSFGSVSLFVEINYFLRSIFVMGISVLAYSALKYADTNGECVERYIRGGVIVYAAVAAGFIIFSAATGIGNLTYGKWAFGFKSFFVGGNDIGLAMLIGLVFTWCRLWNKNDLSSILLIAFITVGVALIGSRAAWGGVVGITVTFALAYLFLKQVQSKLTYFLKVIITVVVVGGGSFAGKLVFDNLEALAYSIERVTDLLDGVSPRQRLERAGYYVLEQRSTMNDVLGQGTQFFYEVKTRYSHLEGALGKGGRAKQTTYKAVEQDPFDFYGIYGIILGSMFVLYHLVFWVWSIVLFYRYRSIDYFSFCFAFTIFFCHGVIAGHAMITPQVGTVVGCLYGLMKFTVDRQKRREATQQQEMLA